MTSAYNQDISENQASTLRDDPEEAHTQKGIELINEAIGYRGKNAFTTALSYLDRAESFFTARRHLGWLVYLQHEKALTMMGMGDHEEAQSIFERAEDGYLRLYDRRGLAILLLNKANLHKGAQSYDEQLDALLYTEYIVEKHRIHDLTAAVKEALADYFFERGRYFEASQYYRQALDEIGRSEEPDPGAETPIKIGLARACEEIFLYDEAELAYKDLYQKLAKQKDIRTLTTVMSDLCRIYKKKGRTDLERDMADKMLNLNKHLLDLN